MDELICEVRLMQMECEKACESTVAQNQKESSDTITVYIGSVMTLLETNAIFNSREMHPGEFALVTVLPSPFCLIGDTVCSKPIFSGSREGRKAETHDCKYNKFLTYDYSCS